MHRAPVVRLSALYFAYVGVLGPYFPVHLEAIGMSAAAGLPLALRVGRRPVSTGPAQALPLG
ncbi:MAG: hypothetical protein A3I00_05575 [Betaproteobacteria bacterium RIFCSPLOWO2_02_FULL_64_12]|nr:MAG: hypothetical protein A3I00_05575 [Betaproteobacteria bacterium RIFCSPLOWO2_02_FULL_64_12]